MYTGLKSHRIGRPRDFNKISFTPDFLKKVRDVDVKIPLELTKEWQSRQKSELKEQKDDPDGDLVRLLNETSLVKQFEEEKEQVESDDRRAPERFESDRSRTENR